MNRVKKTLLGLLENISPLPKTKIALYHLTKKTKDCLHLSNVVNMSARWGQERT